MIHGYKKLNDDDNTSTQDTRFIYRLCFRRLLIICHRPDWVITKLPIFLSLFYFFLLVAGEWISYSYWRSLWPCRSQNICVHCQKCRVFMTFKNLGCLAFWTKFCETLRQSFLKPTKLRVSWESGTECDIYARRNLLYVVAWLVTKTDPEFNL
jgi:hypothetical protein